MVGPDLSLDTLRAVVVMFPQAIHVLQEEFGWNLPFSSASSEVNLERIRFAAIKLSDGRIKELHDAVDRARTDWRDLLVEAGFADETRAHLDWLGRKRDVGGK